MVVQVEHDADTGPLVQLEDVREVEAPLVVLDDEAAPSAFGQGLEGAHYRSSDARASPYAPDVDHDDGFGPRPERIEKQRILLDVEPPLARRPPDPAKRALSTGRGASRA